MTIDYTPDNLHLRSGLVELPNDWTIDHDYDVYAVPAIAAYVGAGAVSGGAAFAVGCGFGAVFDYGLGQL